MKDYARVFGADDLRVLTVGDSPSVPGLPPDPGHVVHAEFTLGGSPLMAADGAKAICGILVHEAASPEAARRVFDTLAESGAVERPLGPSFWSPAFGIVTDRWGVTWRISAAPSGGT